MQQEYPKVCFDAYAKLQLEPCLTWLREIERSPSTDVRSSAAAIYGLIAPNAAASELRADLYSRSAELVRGVLGENPRHPGALLSFASMAEANEESVRRLRDVVAVDPNPRNLESLARALMDTEGGVLEAAALNERAYERQMSRAGGDYAWRFARNAMWAYERAGSPERAERLRKRVAGDYGLAAMLEKAANPAAADPASLDRIVQDLCREMTLTLFGAKPCVDSLDHLVSAVDRRPAGEASRLEQTMSAAMLTAARSGHRLDAVDAGWRRRFETALERHVGAEVVTRFRDTESIITLE